MNKIGSDLLLFDINENEIIKVDLNNLSLITINRIAT
jgi:hypothetical protein